MPLYIIADLHFDDTWICEKLRPFDDLDEMNEFILSNCRNQIDPGDSFLFLGDIIGKDGTEKDVWYWYDEMPEIDCWVPGDHDHIARSEYDKIALPACEPFQKQVEGHWFRFKHKQYREDETDHWIVHGHKHNEKPEEYPFLDPETRRINVSGSMIGYKPIAMKRIVELIETEKRYKFAPDTSEID